MAEKRIKYESKRRQGPSVLVIDDDEDMQNLYHATFGNEARVHYCADTETAEDILIKKKIDVLITDRYVADTKDPGEIVRIADYTRNAPVRILITGSSVIDMQMRYGRKFDYIMQKPIVPSRLRKMVLAAGPAASVRNRRRR